jgi:SAM-dependent methyltransferase
MTAQEQHGSHGGHGGHDGHDGAGGHGEHGGHGGHDGEGWHRTHRFNPANVERLIGEERRALLPPEETLRAAGIGPGQTVVDLGCGPGFFTLPAAALVGDGGRVYGVDVQPEMVEVCRRRAAEAGLRRVEVLQSTETRVPLPDGVADRVFVAFVLHEADDQAAFLGEARRLLRPGGEVAIVEWQPKAGPAGPPREHRVSTDEIVSLASPTGLRLLAERALNDSHYLVRLGV